MEKMLEFAKAVSIDAGKLINSYYKKEKNAREKRARDIVTDADLQAEALILEAIAKKYPSHGILSEEKGAITGKEYTWIVDPIDGTINFASDIMFYSVAIALVNEKETIAAVVHDPSLGETFSALKGKGAYCNKEKMCVSEISSLDRCLLALPPASRIDDVFKDKESFLSLSKQTLGSRYMGSTQLELAYVAAGRFQGIIKQPQEPWDFLAGALLIQEAKGNITTLRNSTLPLTKSDFVGALPSIHAKLLEYLK